MIEKDFLNFIGNPKVHSVKISSVGYNRFRVNVFTKTKNENCVVDKVEISSSYFVECIDGNITDLTLKA